MRDYNRIVIPTKDWDHDRFEEIGRGGEATIYRLKPELVAKIFHRPDDSDFEESPADQKAALERHRDMQKKLFYIPEGLPDTVVTPSHIIENKTGRILGYAMPFKNGMTLDRFAKSSSTMSDDSIMRLLCKIYDIVDAVHKKGMVIGDLNEFNILVCGGKPHLIDVDSTQFASYKSLAFTPRFTDPDLLEVAMTHGTIPRFGRFLRRLGRIVHGITKYTRRGRAAFAYRALLWGAVKPKSEAITLKHAHTEMSDWYSFMVIAMRLFTYTDPYGGTHPKATLGMRIKDRITVFHPDVVYPQSARSLDSLPRPILEAFFRCFHEGKRFVPDRKLFGTDDVTAKATRT